MQRFLNGAMFFHPLVFTKATLVPPEQSDDIQYQMSIKAQCGMAQS